MEVLAIVERHEKRLATCGDKLMNAERDMTKLLNFMEKLSPICMAAKAVHDVMDRPGSHPMDMVVPLTAMSVALRNAGLIVDNPDDPDNP